VLPGVYPAAVTGFDAKGRVDLLANARLHAWFEAAGCAGVVLAGTNGEGPSLSAVEKRDMLRGVVPGKLQTVLGVATSSSDEAVWLCKRAAEFGATATLVMPPSYFREATEDGIARWFLELMDRSPIAVLVYNFPKRTGIAISADLLGRLAEHDRFGGAKDSSGERENLSGYRRVTDKPLFVGDETLLMEALQEGWTGTISGASNVVPDWISTIVREWHEGERESAETKFQLLLPVIRALRSQAQPGLNKALLHRLGVLPDPALRLPLTQNACTAEVELLMRERLGVRFSD
jgi:4-hydroxy-tetrahydrodipicolinate synthase